MRYWEKEKKTINENLLDEIAVGFGFVKAFMRIVCWLNGDFKNI